MATTPFKLKSGNSPLFKQMGSSPLLEHDPQALYHPEEHPLYKEKLQKKGTPKPKKRVSYAEAFKKADPALYGDLSLEEYTAEAKRQSASKKAGKGWDVPKKKMISKVDTTVASDDTDINIEDTPADTDTNVEVVPFKPIYKSRKEIKLEKTARKSSGRLNRKERKYEKLASKAESALAEGKGRKAKRLAKRADRKLRKKGVRTSDEGVGKTSDRLLDLGL